jgi:signal transduction histidine kinase
MAVRRRDDGGVADTEQHGTGAGSPVTGAARMRWRRPSTVDIVLGAVVIVLMLGEFAADWRGPDITAPGVIVAVLVIMGIAVSTRTMAPFASFLVNAAGVIAVIALGFDGLNYQWTNLLCLYTVAERSRTSLSYAALILGEIGVTAWFLLVREPQPPAIQLFVMLAWLVGWTAGMRVATRRREIARQHEHAVEAEARHAAETRATIAEERAEMARELHDSIGHSVTLMVMQAGAARRSIERDAATAAAAMEVVERTGRAALGELDRLIGSLHHDSEQIPGPVPGVADLADLAERTTSSGLDVDVDLDPHVTSAPQAVQLGVFRLVQEALTNTLKHAGASRARVEVRLDGGHLVASVSDDGRGVPGDGRRDGRGLIGLAARIDALGGSFTHGPRPHGGYRVACRIPLA